MSHQLGIGIATWQQIHHHNYQARMTEHKVINCKLSEHIPALHQHLTYKVPLNHTDSYKSDAVHLQSFHTTTCEVVMYL